MRRFRNWIFGILLGLIFIEIWFGFPFPLSHEETIAPVKQKEEQSTQAEQKMKGVHLVESRGGERDWELFSDFAEGYGGQGKWRLQKVKIHFYSENSLQFTVTGREAEIDTKTKDMRIEGDVRTASENGYTFQSPLLLYLSKSRLLQSPGPIQMRGPSDSQGEGLRLTANYMRSFVDRSEMNLEGNVSAEKKFKNGRKFRISSERARFSGEHFRAQFQSQVVIEYESMKLESPDASFEYKATSSLLDAIQMRGGVKISDFEKYATAESVRIEPDTNKIVLFGRPRVVQGQDELMGEQIVFIDGGKKVKIEKIRARVEKAPGE